MVVVFTDLSAGFALFADLTTPQLQRVAHMFEEQVYADGELIWKAGRFLTEPATEVLEHR